MRVYFHIDEIGRDSVTASALKKRFSKYGVKLVYGNRFSTSILLKYTSHAFDCIILPRPFFIGIFNTNTPIVVLLTEAVGRLFSSEQFALVSLLDRKFMEGDNSDLSRVNKFLLWGDKSYRIIKENYPEILDKFVVVGNPRHDPACIPNHKNEFNKIKIGFITRQPLLNPFMGENPMAPIVREVFLGHDQYSYYKNSNEYLRWQDDPVRDALYKQASDTEIMLNIIKILDQKKYEIEIRVHPTENIETWNRIFDKYKIKAKVVEQIVPFTHWANDQDYVVGPASTSAFDSFVVGAIPISTKNIDPNRKNHLYKFSEENGILQNYVLSPSSVDELISLISHKKQNNLINPMILKILQEEGGFRVHNSPIDEIVKHTIEAAKGGGIKKQSLLHYVLYLVLDNFFNIIRSIYYQAFRIDIVSSRFILNQKTKIRIDSLTR